MVRKASAAHDDLAEYRRRRDFGVTSEPRGRQRQGSPDELSFCIQKHDATRLHFDFRLELDGVLKSWAVTRGPSLNPKDKRLAVETEDHPLDYGGFEGIIPAGQYGGGTVMLWDRGSWIPKGDPREGLARGNLKFELHGERMHGDWALIRMKGRKGDRRSNWLLIKERDDRTDPQADLVGDHTTSVATGRDMAAIAGDRDAPAWNDGNAPEPVEEARKSRKVSKPKRAGGDRSGKRTLPCPDFVPPQLATLSDEMPVGESWLHELKLDGYRIVCALGREGVRLYTRKGQDWTDRFPRIARLAAALPVDGALLDGEVVALDAQGVSHFGNLQNAMKREDVALTYFVFDMLWHEGEDLRALPLSERKSRLAAWLQPVADENIRYSDHMAGRGKDAFVQACRLGAEGLIAKRADAPYQSTRTKDWLKVKCEHRQEFVILGAMPSSAKGRPFASLILGVYDGSKLVYAGKVGTGFNAGLMRELEKRLKPLARKTAPVAEVPAEARQARWVTPKLVAEVSFTEWTSDGRLRHPSFQGLREDKAAEDVVREAPAAPEPAKGARSRTASRPPRKAVSPEAGRRTAEQLDVGGNIVAGIRLSHPDRVLYPGQNITKRELALYYEMVGEWMLPHVARRPLSLVRCPEGQTGQCFFQKHLSGRMPDALRSVRVAEKTVSRDYAYVEDVPGLVALAQIGVLEVHPWGATVDDPERPDRMIFDLDPAPDVAFAKVKQAARELHDLLEAAGLQSFLKTTGGKGLHVVVPLTPYHEWELVRGFSRALAGALAEAAPDRYTATLSKAARKGRIFIDVLRNARGATAVAPCSPRARPGAPVACPLDWAELDRLQSASQYTVPDLSDRMHAVREDPWADMVKLRQRIPSGALRQFGLEDRTSNPNL